MTRWGLFLAGYGIGLMLFRLVWTAMSARLGNIEQSATPSIPSAMDDWDEEFKRLTGAPPFPELTVRTGEPATGWSYLPGEVVYAGYRIADSQHIQVFNCQAIND